MTENKLLDHILLRVMHYLSLEDLCLGARLVNKRWHEVSCDRTLWKSPDFQCKADSLTDSSLLSILSEVSAFIEELNLRRCVLLSDEAFQHGSIVCPNLRRVDVSSTMITNSGLSSLVTKYPHLERLACLKCSNLTQSYVLLQGMDSLREFMDPYEDCLDVPEDANEKLLPIIERNPHLEQVRLACKLLEDEVLLKLVERCSSLQTLHLPNCVWISGDVLVGCVTRLPELKSLDISGMTVSDEHLVKAANRLPKLEELNVTECRKVTDIGIMSIVENCQGLRHVILNESKGYSGNISDVGLKHIGQCCPGLEELTMCFCPSVTDTGLRYLVEGCRQLKHLDISGCLSLTDSALKCVAKCGEQLERLRASECVQLTSHSVNDVLQNCPKLMHLELETCHYLTKLTFHAMGDLKSAVPVHADAATGGAASPGRDSIHLGTAAVEPHLSKVQILDLSFCSKLTDGSLREVARHCRLLRYLSLRGCLSISDSGIEEIARHCHQLQVVDLSGGSSFQPSRLTNASLAAIGTNSSNLVMLSITKCPQMRTQGLVGLIEQCKTLKRVSLTAGPEMQLLSIIQRTRQVRGRCWLQDFNADYISEDTKGNFLVKFSPLAFPVLY